MAMSEIRKEFQARLKEGIDAEAINAAHIKRVRQMMANHKYNAPSQNMKKGKETANGR